MILQGGGAFCYEKCLFFLVKFPRGDVRVHPAKNHLWIGYYMAVSKNRGKTPKMDGENNGKPYFLMDDLGGKPTIFRVHIHISKRLKFPASHSVWQCATLVRKVTMHVWRNRWWIGEWKERAKNMSHYFFWWHVNISLYKGEFTPFRTPSRNHINSWNRSIRPHTWVGFYHQQRQIRIISYNHTSWWFQPNWKMLVNMGSSSPNGGEHSKKYLSWHHLA